MKITYELNSTEKDLVKNIIGRDNTTELEMFPDITEILPLGTIDGRNMDNNSYHINMDLKTEFVEDVLTVYADFSDIIQIILRKIIPPFKKLLPKWTATDKRTRYLNSGYLYMVHTYVDGEFKEYFCRKESEYIELMKIIHVPNKRNKVLDIIDLISNKSIYN